MRRYRICWRYRQDGEVHRGVWFGGPGEHAEAEIARHNRLDGHAEYWLEIWEAVTRTGGRARIRGPEARRASF